MTSNIAGTDMIAPMEAEADVFGVRRKVLAGFLRGHQTRCGQFCSSEGKNSLGGTHSRTEE